MGGFLLAERLSLPAKRLLLLAEPLGPRARVSAYRPGIFPRLQSVAACRQRTVVTGDASLLVAKSSLLVGRDSLLVGDASVLKEEASPLDERESLHEDRASRLEFKGSLLDDDGALFVGEARVLDPLASIALGRATFAIF